MAECNTDQTRINYLIDRQGISDLMAEYRARLDEYDPEGLVETFLEDGVMNQGPGRGRPVKGRASIAKGCASARHFSSGPAIIWGKAA